MGVKGQGQGVCPICCSGICSRSWSILNLEVAGSIPDDYGCTRLSSNFYSQEILHSMHKAHTGMRP